jgi:Na+/glutamate symporter
MSGGTFHVHGPHDHEIEHAVQHAAHGAGTNETTAAGGLVNQIAIFTAIIATFGALFAYLGGATQANAGLFKNNAAIKKTEASNQWNYFQAKSTKQSLAEVSRDLSTSSGDREKYQGTVDRYEKEKKEIQVTAEKIEAEAKDWDKQSDAQMHQHHRWAQATTALQVAIALAAIALLTKKKWLEWGMFGMGAIGVGIGALAVLHI